jgi:hypothetical protein
MRFLIFAIAIYLAGVLAVDKTMFQGRYTQAVWQEAGKQVRWANYEVRYWLDRIGIL